MAAILILEDNYDVAASWQRAFLENGHSVDVSLTSSEAVAHVQVRPYDLYIVDLLIKNDEYSSRDSGRKFLQYLNVDNRHHTYTEKIIGVTAFRPMKREHPAKSIFSLYNVRNVMFKPFASSELVAFAETFLED